MNIIVYSIEQVPSIDRPEDTRVDEGEKWPKGYFLDFQWNIAEEYDRWPKLWASIEYKSGEVP